MKKTLIAAALIAGFAGVAQAESSVTLYGVVDAGLQVTTNKDAGSFGFTQGQLAANRFGLKGSEDLGNGTSVIFNLEGGFDITTGASKKNVLFGRKAILGLADEDLGTLTAGYQKDAADALGVGDVVGAFDDADAFNDLQDRSLQALYVSPELAGAQFALSWGGNHIWGASTSTVSNDHIAVALAYSLDELKLSFSHDWDKTNKDTGKPGNTQTTFYESQKEWTVGAEYDLDVATVGLRYQHYRDYQYLPNTWKEKAKRFEIGFAVPLNETGTVLTAFQREIARVKSDYAPGTEALKTKSNLFRLAYVENLSKRSSAYVGYVRTHVTAYAELPAHAKSVTRNNAFVVGLSHKF